MIKIGIKNEKTIKVDNSNTANTIGSGDLNVFSTPSMIALIENTANLAVKPFLDESHSTVGTVLNIKHISPSPIGMKITCYVELIKAENKRLTFSFKVFDEKDLIGEGTHERYIIENERFLKKANEKVK